ncbi:MAG: class I SAM-dependent methyltransferase [Candidatus Poribacteria bacterium]|nr:class I SAM-dependent methyltransferase [Candidatus Poribacteria bacterium]
MKSNPWYSDTFDEEYLRLYRHARPPERIRRDVENVLRLLRLPRGRHILDLCCGHGSHSIELAKHEYKVKGFDQSDYMLGQAKLDAERAEVEVGWIRGDMRDLPFEREFDAVINMFNSFGFLETEKEDQRVLNLVSKALRPNGLFLQELPNLEAFARTFQPTTVTRLADETFVIDEREFDMVDSQLHLRHICLYPNGERTSLDFHQRLYPPPKMLNMLQVAGFEIEEIFGELDGRSLTLDSNQLVILSRKRPEVVVE